MNSDIGLVIQGPIMSNGRSLFDLDPRDYNCAKDIKEMLKHAISLKITPIVITWEGQDLSQFSQSERKYIKAVSFPKKNIVSRLRNDWEDNSKYRQFYSTLEGIKYLKKMKCKFILKVRTDTLVPLDLLVPYLETLLIDIDSKTIFTPMIDLEKPNLFSDFYFFASTTCLQNFCELILYTKEICANIHYDVFYRLLMFMQKSKIGLKDVFIIYPKNRKYTSKQIKFIRLGLCEYFKPLPEMIWTNTNWRGSKIGKSGTKKTYRFSEFSTHEILQEFDSYNYRIVKSPNIEIENLISYVFSSKFERNIRKVKAKLRNIGNRYGT
jgi:hypothetical protein